MKRIFTISAFILLAAANGINSQNCDFARTGVRYNYSNTDGSGNCIINLDLYFDLRTNAGSKYMALHIWPATSYPNPAYDNAPLSTDLANATTIVIHHFQEHLELHSGYNPDAQVHPQYLDMNLTIGPAGTVGYERFTITNINLTVPGGCSIPQSFIVDMWSTESVSMNQVLCFDKGTVFYANNPKAIGLLNCNLPRTFNVQIFSIDPGPMTIDYKVYLDNGDNVFNRITDTLVVKAQNGIVISTASNFSSEFISYPPYSNMAPWANMNLWVEVASPSLPNSVIYAIENSCSALSVKLLSFDAKKEGQTVLLNWITGGEALNKGFYVERRMGDGKWDVLNFIPSKGVNGNSNVEILYSYTDFINPKGIIEYRLKQVDINGKFEYSDIRAVRSEAVNTLTIFPNPSHGNVVIIFPVGNSLYSVGMYDTGGKLLQAWQNCNSILSVDNLKAGIYIIKVKAEQDKATSTFKLIVR
jgi:hypothetical protein